MKVLVAAVAPDWWRWRLWLPLGGEVLWLGPSVPLVLAHVQTQVESLVVCWGPSVSYEVKLQRFTWETNHIGFMSETCPPVWVWSTQNRAELFIISNGHYSQLELNDKLLKCSQNTHTPRLGANIFLWSWVSKLFIWLREIFQFTATECGCS